MSLQLDPRQRAMLREMGVHLWLPQGPDEAGVANTALVAETPHAPVATRPAAASLVTASRPVVPPPAVQPVAARAPAVPVQLPDAANADWPALAQAVAACQACGLCAGRKAAVLGDGAVQADWLVVGDAPDEDEERAGVAFAGQAGQLLDNMLKAVGAARTGQGRGGAYLTNIVKCRPQGARNPEAAELASCEAYLRRQVALVRPKVILAMGRFAVQVLLQDSLPDVASRPLGKLRGASYSYQGVPVVVTYPPKNLLRSLPDKAKAWADLCLALGLVDGGAPPGTAG